MNKKVMFDPAWRHKRRAIKAVTFRVQVVIILTSMRNQRYLKLILTGVGITLIVLGLAPASASSANISHSYKAAANIPVGSIVSLDPQRSDYVQAANSNNGLRLLGVAVASNDSLIAVDASPGTVQVATSGTASVLVSTLNGNINVGDQVAVSPFNGIGMKALPGSRTIGLAQTSFNGGTSGITTEQVTDKNGKTSSVTVGFLRVSIEIGTDATTGGTDLNSLQKVVKALTGHVVPTFRAAVSLVIAVVALIALVTLIYASIYGSIISVGRNPLAKYAVFRTLGSVLAMAALTTVISGLTIYLLLR